MKTSKQHKKAPKKICSPGKRRDCRKTISQANNNSYDLSGFFSPIIAGNVSRFDRVEPRETTPENAGSRGTSKLDRVFLILQIILTAVSILMTLTSFVWQLQQIGKDKPPRDKKKRKQKEITDEASGTVVVEDVCHLCEEAQDD